MSRGGSSGRDRLSQPTMKKIHLFAAACGLAVLASCAAGPHQVRRTVDDFDHKLYVQNPLLNGVLWVIPVFPIAYYGAMIVDFFVVDAYHFWFKDVWAGKGTGFEHFTVESESRVQSLLIDDAKFLKAVE